MPFNFFGKKTEDDNVTTPGLPGVGPGNILPEDQQELLENDVSLLDEGEGMNTQKLHKDVQKTVISAAENTLKKLHIVQCGRCPVCGEHIYQHMAASICPNCGWNQYDLPKSGKVKIHLRDNGIVTGDRAYVLKDGTCLVINNEVVIAKVPTNAYNWVEYDWPPDELAQRKNSINSKMKVLCGWCNQETDPSKDGFHLLHIAFGASQERYCFCSDECLDAFRNMYPARVHRNCYEQNCDECNLCVKRYTGEADEIRLLAKDFIKVKKG